MEPVDECAFGNELIKQVAKYLFRGAALIDVHRDYCGVGLLSDNHGAFAAEVHEGLAGSALVRWKSEEEFIDFFAAQSDSTMNRSEGSIVGFASSDAWRHGNQTITRARLEAFVAKAQAGEAYRSIDHIAVEPVESLVLEEVLDKTKLLRFMRDELHLQLREAHEMLSQTPVVIRGITGDEDDGARWVQLFAEAGGRCTIRSRKD